MGTWFVGREWGVHWSELGPVQAGVGKCGRTRGERRGAMTAVASPGYYARLRNWRALGRRSRASRRAVTAWPSLVGRESADGHCGVQTDGKGRRRAGQVFEAMPLASSGRHASRRTPGMPMALKLRLRSRMRGGRALLKESNMSQPGSSPHAEIP